MKKFAIGIGLLIVLAIIIGEFWSNSIPNNNNNVGIDIKNENMDIEDNISKHPILDRLYAELDSDDVYNDSILFGYWFKPHEACHVNIFLHKDYTYEFKYYDDMLIELMKTGTFTFDGKVIRLASDSGWDELFDGILYYKHNGTNYYLTDSDNELILVKGSD